MKSNSSIKSIQVRLDIWLWAARFYKSRALAKRAISLGKIKISGNRCKASRLVSSGVTLQLRQDIYERQIVITGVSETRNSAPIASQLYAETAESIKSNQELNNNMSNVSWTPRPNHKPNSRERRLLANSKRFSDRD
jgi:ribosome-associated heat shock protein Hsp15